MMHTDIRRALADNLNALHKSHTRLPVNIRPYQLETLVQMKQWLEDLSGTRRGYVEQATGLGKTVLFAALAAFCTKLRTLVVVPTKVLVEQTARAMVKFTGGIVGHISSLGDIRDSDGRLIAVRTMDFTDIVVTTDESLGRFAHRFATEFNPDVVIFDECHWGFIGITQQALNGFERAVIVGYSATPDYLGTSARRGYKAVTIDNGQVLYGSPDRFATSIFGSLIDRRTVPWGIREGWLSPLAWGQLSYDISLNSLPLQESEVGLDYPTTVLGRFMDTQWLKLSQAIRHEYQGGRYHLAERQVFAVCPSVKTAEALAKTVSSLGVPAACITGGTPTKERVRILGEYGRNRIRLLTSVMVLREGWDAPNAEVCLMLRPTRSRVLYVQVVGRVLRPASDGRPKVALVLDGYFENTRFQPLTAPMLYATAGQELSMGEVFLNVRDGASGFAQRAVSSPYLPGDGTAARYTVEPIVVEHIADKDGIIEFEGNLYYSEIGLNKLGLFPDLPYLKLWGAHGNVKTVKAQSYSGRTTVFYLRTDVEREMKAVYKS